MSDLKDGPDDDREQWVKGFENYIANVRATLQVEILLDVIRDEGMPPKAVHALSDFLEELATTIRSVSAQEGGCDDESV